jgi:hypothetical protein
MGVYHCASEWVSTIALGLGYDDDHGTSEWVSTIADDDHGTSEWVSTIASTIAIGVYHCD